jgi:uncharacterized protein (DUF433 family)
LRKPARSKGAKTAHLLRACFCNFCNQFCLGIETTRKVSLTAWKDGTIRVKSTRLLVAMIIYAHQRSEIPEDIFESFPSDFYTVADIYSIIGYYLANKAIFDKYLAKREKEAEKTRKQIESIPGYKEKTKN